MPTETKTPPTKLVRTMLLCNSLTVLAVTPAFLLGAMTLEVRRDIAVGPSDVGTAVGIMFTVSAISARLLGAIVQRIGHRWAMVVSGGLSAITLVLCGFATGLPWLAWTFALGGLANGTAHPAVNETIAKTMPLHRQGLAFGIKQSSIPAATLCCAIAVPAVAPELSWRVAFWIFAALAVALAAASLTLRPMQDDSRNDPGQHPSEQSQAFDAQSLTTGQMILVTAVAGAGMAAATSLGVFLIPTGVHVGLDAALAASIGALCSVICIAMRIGLGWSLDRYAVRNEYLITSAFLIVGSSGYVFLTLDSELSFIIGAAVGYGIGWGWTGLMQASVVKDNKSRVASATGALMVGTSFGAAFGPFAFGRVAESYSYGHAWLMSAALSLVAGLSLGLWRARSRHMNRQGKTH